MRSTRARIGTVALALGLAVASAALAGARLECRAPEPVCAARASVFAIASFDEGSATLIAPGLLVTNRHNVADNPEVEVIDGDGRRRQGRVVPTAYPGDLVLIEVPGLDGPALAPAPPGTAVSGDLYTVAADVRLGLIRAYPPGRLMAPLAPGRPLAHLHSTAYSQYGNSGGALVDVAGRLVGIVTSGGEGRYAAVPAGEIARLRAQSGPRFAAESRRLGAAYGRCKRALDGRGPAPSTRSS
ncbi:MAG: serine protease, partial [Kiloniellales bacterium]